MLSEFEVGETLEIKEEIIQVSDKKAVTDQTRNDNCDSNFSSVNIREADSFVVKNKLPTQKKKKIQEINSGKKYQCEKCMRIYIQRQSLFNHKKFECGVMPQFRCKLCGKQFKRKDGMTGHMERMHIKKRKAASINP
ncbi:zinc finger protein 665-like [Belonocnema kinseyi]|uniref:zinc finger protein 665-like n=1 Tax=Belonocnema kinseyi TaxID=2817044 RepID=UPI00143CE320|nr:zinc finger protein 665-like [Belonocnema kinseyi]